MNSHLIGLVHPVPAITSTDDKKVSGCGWEKKDKTTCARKHANNANKLGDVLKNATIVAIRALNVKCQLNSASQPK